jgi:hypothetical protein
VGRGLLVVTKLGLLCIGVGCALGLRSLLARLSMDSSRPDEAGNFAADQERAWATIGPRVAVACIAAGLVLALIGVLS